MSFVRHVLALLQNGSRAFIVQDKKKKIHSVHNTGIKEERTLLYTSYPLRLASKLTCAAAVRKATPGARTGLN